MQCAIVYFAAEVIAFFGVNYLSLTAFFLFKLLFFGISFLRT